MSISPIRTATRRLTYFFRCGNKENMEGLLRQLFYRRAIISKKALKIGAGSTSSDLFQAFFLAATPFIGLKTRRRRRGKRLIVKLSPLERNRGERSSFVALSNTLQTSGAVSKSFVDRLERELETLSNKTSSDIKHVSSLQEKRDEVHKLAYSSRPYRWLRRVNPFSRKRLYTVITILSSSGARASDC